ncbi:ATP-dependent RNA helicase [Actinidia chinensis var. chinensis]|uniref:ATP-dependent RNA helicase n=1 Tax=Actinidia chinensis var. chinensis TaxID=1590841 RepID=A0A2R6Q8T2_ACTCC|nr:ATP-dependent RNA helicase [Actinidia chinensis var. chinensis]
MAKRVISLGVHKRKPKKHHKKKRLFKKIVDYLKSDSYMFAPLVSSQPSGFSTTDPSPISPTGVETKKPSEEKNKKLLKKVEDYLKSDSYMYAPLIGAPPPHGFDANTVSPHSEPVSHVKKITAAVSTRKITKKINQPTEQTVKEIREDQLSDSSLLKSTVVQQTLAHLETVKHIVHKSCRSLSVPGKGMPGRETRKVVVD